MKRNFLPLLLALIAFGSCKKSDSGGDPLLPPGSDSEAVKLTYGDSVLYVKDGENENIVLPQGNLKGKFTGFPEGIELNEVTGAINVDRSETGLRYRVTFVPDDKPQDTLTAIVLLSGISYLDRIYYLDAHDTTAFAVYNGRTENDVPGTNGSSVFDEGGGCNGVGVAVNPADGKINLSQTLRNGVFGGQPQNGAQKEVELLYRLNDNSKKALNKLKVKLYYFDTPDDITQDLVQQMNERRDMFLGLNPQPPFLEIYNPTSRGLVNVSNGLLGTAKPRPPCVFLVGRASN